MNERNISSYVFCLTLVIAFSLVSSTAMAYVLSTTKTGGDCSAIGVWNAKTKTCTLSKDIHYSESSLVIDSNPVIVKVDAGGITLDGNGHSVVGSALDTEIGIYIAQRGVTVKNVTVTGCAYGIFLTEAVRNKISNNSLSNNMYGLSITTNSNNNTITGNTASYSSFAGIFLGNTANGNNLSSNTVMNSGYGIALFGMCSNNSLTGNSLSNNWTGVFANDLSNSNIISENTFFTDAGGIGNGIVFQNVTENNIVHRNNFINNTAVSSPDSINFYNLSTGGNYWSSFDTPEEGCNDANNDGFCDQPFTTATGVIDYLPWTTQDGWK